MKCPFCRTNDSRVIDSRALEQSTAIRRRRQCENCRRRFTTYERVEHSPLRVIKKDGSRVPFDRQKILTGMMKACEKRPVSLQTLESITDAIELEIYDTFDREVSSKVIGELVMRELAKLDQVAYVRFASVYREFKDLNQFMDELKALLAAGGDGRM